MTRSGGCYGYSVDSTVDLHYLRRGGNLDQLTVTVHDQTGLSGGELVLDWPRRPSRPVAIRLYRSNGRYGLWVEDAGWFRIDVSSRNISLPAGGDPLRTEERLWGLPSLLTFLADGDLPLHAGAVEVDGRAILYTAPTRFGKTTLSAALWSHGYRLLTEDLCRIRFIDGDPHVFPGPAMLRMRHDMAARLQIPNVEQVGRDDDRVHFALDPQLRGDSSPLPIAGIVFLREDDTVDLAPVDSADAIRDLWVVTFHLPEQEAVTFGRVAELVASTATWNLMRPLRPEALPSTVEALTGATHAA